MCALCAATKKSPTLLGHVRVVPQFCKPIRFAEFIGRLRRNIEVLLDFMILSAPRPSPSGDPLP